MNGNQYRKANAKGTIHRSSPTHFRRGGCAMSFFGRRHQQERDRMEQERDNIEKAITAMSARLKCLEALTFGLVAELSPTKRDRLLQQFQEVVGGLKILPPPTYVPNRRDQDFRDELNRVMQIFIEDAKNLKARSTSPNRNATDQ